MYEGRIGCENMTSDVEKEDFDWDPRVDAMETEDGVCKDRKIRSIGAILYQDEQILEEEMRCATDRSSDAESDDQNDHKQNKELLKKIKNEKDKQLCKRENPDPL
jgi:hypothetical protein